MTRERGVLLDWPPATGPYAGEVSLAPSLTHALATIHPSAVLRGDPSEREEMLRGLVEDLRLIVPTLTR